MYSYDYKIISETGSDPVTLAEAKTWLKMDSISDDDTLITDLITAARKYCENLAGLSFIVYNIQLRIDKMRGDYVIPLVYTADTINSVKKNYEGVESTIETTVYELDTFNNVVRLKYDQDWGNWDYIIVDYDTVNDSSAYIEKVMKNWIAEEYDYRKTGKEPRRNKIHDALEAVRRWQFM